MELLKFETFTKLHYRNAVGNVLVQAHPQQCLRVFPLHTCLVGLHQQQELGGLQS